MWFIVEKFVVNVVKNDLNLNYVFLKKFGVDCGILVFGLCSIK